MAVAAVSRQSPWRWLRATATLRDLAEVGAAVRQAPA